MDETDILKERKERFWHIWKAKDMFPKAQSKLRRCFLCQQEDREKFESLIKELIARGTCI